MPQNEKESKDVPSYIPLVAGGFSGVATRFLCQPLDVVKIRFQLQVEPISKKSAESKYTSLLQAVRLIIKEEGINALWKGHAAAQALSLIFGVAQFGSFEAIVSHANHYPLLAKHKATVEFMSGFASGCMASILTSPLDIVRTRMILQGNTKMYLNTVHGLVHILHNEGIRGWFRGLSPTLIQIGPLSGIQFASYHYYKRLFEEFESTNKIKSQWFSVSEVAVAGALSGFTSKIMVYPLDLFRKRMQFQGFQGRQGFGKNFTCTSLISCFTETVKGERSRGLFKGLGPSLLKASIVNSLIFTLYEQMYNFLLNRHENQ